MARSGVQERWLLRWTLLLSLAGPSLCGSMTAWWTDIGPSFALQNLTTGEIQYSACNSNNTPLYPNPPNILSTRYKAKINTSLAGTGWYDKTITWASLFYQNNNDDIVNAIYTCNWADGTYTHYESKVISDKTGTPQVHPQSGLSVALLGENEGYRVFFHDKNRELQILKFTQQDLWSYLGPASVNTNRTGMAIHSMFSGLRNVTVVTPRDAANFETVRLNTDGSWAVATFPTPSKITNVTNSTGASNGTSFPYDTSSPPPFRLDEWTANPRALGIAIDTALTRRIFYIGSDKKFHSVASFVSGTTESAWQAQPDTLDTNLPLADTPGGDFAIASDLGTSNIRLYYTVGGVLKEGKYTNGNWFPIADLATKNASAPVSGPADSDSSGLSAGAKAGIGVGVTFGVLLLAAAAVGLYYLGKRQARADVEKEAALTAAAAPKSEVAEVHHAPTAGSRDGSVAGVARTGSGVSKPEWEAEVKDKSPSPEPNPRELDSPNPASELPPTIDRTELPSDRHATELP
ncbi:hypothetical protein B0H63DRAFT_315488 [Podospora didyma]|uniref:Fucose-specific lectin n=1 Tax=Podospora didyma TaxID=330526 RepID=A0AAE0N4Z2_9PEZI|nr:hypothetical protein B0H63DRAFT_315488 [Podospora didyma]